MLKDLTSWGLGIRFEPQTIPQKMLLIHLGPYQFFLDLGKPSIAYDARTELMLTGASPCARLRLIALFSGCQYIRQSRSWEKAKGIVLCGFPSFAAAQFAGWLAAGWGLADGAVVNQWEY